MKTTKKIKTFKPLPFKFKTRKAFVGEGIYFYLKEDYIELYVWFPDNQSVWNVCKSGLIGHTLKHNITTKEEAIEFIKDHYYENF
jgi:hypothetical protein